MAKRRSNVRERMENSSDSEVNYSDVENYYAYEPAKKRRCNYTTRSKPGVSRNVKRMSFPKEENEHTYSNTPIFSSVTCNGEQSVDYTSDSDYEDSKVPASRISERSTSLESTKSGGKAISNRVDTERKFSPKRKPKCFSKNAVMARMNRQRKKEYVEKLEGNIDSLKERNNDMKLKLNEQTQLVANLRNEVRYLRSALSNSKEIGLLLRRICGGDKTDSCMTSSLLVTPPPDQEVNLSAADIEDHDVLWPISPIASPVDNCNESEPSDDVPSIGAEPDSFMSLGVCLHVSKDQVSFEFCEACNRSALLRILGGEDLPMVK